MDRKVTVIARANGEKIVLINDAGMEGIGRNKNFSNFL